MDGKHSGSDARPTGGGAGVAFLLSQLGLDAAAAFAALTAPLGLTPGEAGALRTIARNAGLSQRELARRLGSAPSRVVALVDGLERKGLVQRLADAEDRRVHALQLTPAGTEMLAELRLVATAHEAEMVSPLEPEEVAALADLLLRLARARGLRPEGQPGAGSG